MIATIIISIALILIVAYVIKKMIKDHKAGKHTGGCSACNNCGGCASCEKKEHT